jgi:hypothetical protein
VTLHCDKIRRDGRLLVTSIDAATGAREQVGYAAALGQIRWLDR